MKRWSARRKAAGHKDVKIGGGVSTVRQYLTGRTHRLPAHCVGACFARTRRTAVCPEGLDLRALGVFRDGSQGIRICDSSHAGKRFRGAELAGGRGGLQEAVRLNRTENRLPGDGRCSQMDSGEWQQFAIWRSAGHEGPKQPSTWRWQAARNSPGTARSPC